MHIPKYPVLILIAVAAVLLIATGCAIAAPADAPGYGMYGPHHGQYISDSPCQNTMQTPLCSVCSGQHSADACPYASGCGSYGGGHHRHNSCHY